MTKRKALASLAIGLLLSFSSLGVSAQQKYKFYFKPPPGLTKYTQQHSLDVRDVPGHQLRIGELHTKYGSEAPEYDGVKVVEAWTTLMSDYTNANGRLLTYGVSTLANGDKIFTRAEGTTMSSVAADGSRRITFSNVATITGGTGKFATIRGLLRTTGQSDLKTGTSGTVTEGEYWFEGRGM